MADKITVIRDGSTIETLTKGVDDFSEDRIIRGMVGREIADRFPKRHWCKDRRSKYGSEKLDGTPSDLHRAQGGG